MVDFVNLVSKPDIVVVGSRGASKVMRVLTGSDSAYISSHTAGPTLVRGMMMHQQQAAAN